MLESVILGGISDFLYCYLKNLRTKFKNYVKKNIYEKVGFLAKSFIKIADFAAEDLEIFITTCLFRCQQAWRIYDWQATRLSL